MKYRIRHLLVLRSWHPNHWAKLDKRGLGIKLDTWRWTWCLFQVDLCSTLSAILIWKLHNFEELNIQSCCHFLPFDKKLACFTNYQERRSFPWPLVINNPRTLFRYFNSSTTFSVCKNYWMATGEAVQELFFSIKYFYQERSILVAFQQHGMQFGHILVTGRVPFSSLWACLLANARPVRHFKKSTKYYALLAFTNRQIVLPISKLPRAQKSQRRFNIRFKLSYVYALLRLPNMECVFSSKKLGLQLEMIRKVLFLHALVVRKPLHLKKPEMLFS